MTLDQPVWSQFDGGEPLRCGLCGEQIGKSFGDEPTPAMRAIVVARCFACAAAEEADAITKGSDV
jgi:hypothetical protein